MVAPWILVLLQVYRRRSLCPVQLWKGNLRTEDSLNFLQVLPKAVDCILETVIRSGEERRSCVRTVSSRKNCFLTTSLHHFTSLYCRVSLTTLLHHSIVERCHGRCIGAPRARIGTFDETSSSLRVATPGTEQQLLAETGPRGERCLKQQKQQKQN